MTPRISQELEQALSGKPDGTLKVEGADGATYWVMTEDALQIRNEVLKGLEAAERGEVAEWNPDEVKRDGRRLLNDRQQDA